MAGPGAAIWSARARPTRRTPGYDVGPRGGWTASADLRQLKCRGHGAPPPLLVRRHSERMFRSGVLRDRDIDPPPREHREHARQCRSCRYAVADHGDHTAMPGRSVTLSSGSSSSRNAPQAAHRASANSASVIKSSPGRAWKIETTAARPRWHRTSGPQCRADHPLPRP